MRLGSSFSSPYLWYPTASGNKKSLLDALVPAVCGLVAGVRTVFAVPCASRLEHTCEVYFHATKHEASRAHFRVLMVAVISF